MLTQLLNRLTFWYYRKDLAALIGKMIDQNDKPKPCDAYEMDRIFRKELNWKPAKANKMLTILINSGAVIKGWHPTFKKRHTWKINPEYLK